MAKTNTMGEIKLIRELLEKEMCYIKKDLKGICNRLDDLNGQTRKNTSFRQKALGAGLVLTTIGSMLGFLISGVMK